MHHEIALHKAGDLHPQNWRDLQAIARIALWPTLNRTSTEIDHLTNWRESTRFFNSHAHPNTAASPAQPQSPVLTRPRVSVAIANGNPVGFAYAANRLTGTGPVGRSFNYLFPGRNYLWLPEIYVLPNYRGHGIAANLGRVLLESARPHQPVSTSILADDMPTLQPMLTQLGFQPAGEAFVERFGDGSEPVREVQLRAQTVQDVLAHLPIAG